MSTKFREKYVKELMVKANSEIEAGKYLEAIFVISATYDNRLKTILKNFIGDHHKHNGMGGKLNAIENVYNDYPIVKGHLKANDLDRELRKWSKRRNNLMHDMADDGWTLARVENEAKEVAEDGAILMLELFNAARRIKAKYKQQAKKK